MHSRSKGRQDGARRGEILVLLATGDTLAKTVPSHTTYGRLPLQSGIGPHPVPEGYMVRYIDSKLCRTYSRWEMFRLRSFWEGLDKHSRKAIPDRLVSAYPRG